MEQPPEEPGHTVRRLALRARLTGVAVSSCYGCHAHFYPTSDPDDSHGVCLGWDLQEEGDSISAFSLLALCRVANSCHKNVILYSGTDDTHGLLMQYTSII